MAGGEYRLIGEATVKQEIERVRVQQELERPTNPKEVRVVDPVTGGEKGTKLARFDLIPPEASWALAEVYGRGAKKYADKNWEKGYKWGLSVAALERHLNLWKRGEKLDEDGNYHIIQVAWHAFCLFTFELRGLGTDDVHGASSTGQVPTQKPPEL